jgi:hypothetical protein
MLQNDAFQQRARRRAIDRSMQLYHSEVYQGACGEPKPNSHNLTDAQFG